MRTIAFEPAVSYRPAASKRRKVPPPVRRLTKARRLAEIRAFVNIAFTVLEAEHDGDYKEIANRSGLSVATLHRLQTDKLSLCVRVGTIQALGYAAGLKLELTEQSVRVSLVD